MKKPSYAFPLAALFFCGCATFGGGRRPASQAHHHPGNEPDFTFEIPPSESAGMPSATALPVRKH